MAIVVDGGRGGWIHALWSVTKGS